VSHGFARTGLASTRVPTSHSGGWVRPADWVTLPTVLDGDQKIVMLVAVFNTTNFLAFSATGNYTVDWGDGAAPTNYSSGTTAQKSFAWSDYSPSTLTSQGFRQAVVTITPQSGQNLTALNLNIRHTTPTVAHTTGVLEVVMSAPYFTAMSFYPPSNVAYRMLRRFEWVGSCPITSFYGMFSGCSSLQSVELDTSSGTDFSSMFYGCLSLSSVELDTSLGTNFFSMFGSCSSLQSVELDTSLGTSFSYMFQGCLSLSSVELDTSSGTNFSNMFQSCPSLSSVILTGCKYTVSVAYGVLSGTALDALYTSLGTAAGSQTITVSGNHGTSSDTPSIATAKGWTVSGS